MAVGTSLLTNTPNFLGQLFNADQRRSQFLTIAGGTDGANALITTNPEFPVSVRYNIGGGEQPSISENASMGALSPTYTVKSQAKNVIEIHQESVRISNLRKRATGRLSGISTAGQLPEMSDELAFQLGVQISKMKRDMNWTALNGVYADGGLTSSDVANQTRGIITAITTNVVEGELNSENIAELVRLVSDKGEFIMPMFFANSKNRVAISKAYTVESLTVVDRDRFTGGVAVGKIVTEFGDVFIVTDNDVPDDVILLADMGLVKPVFTLDEDGDVISIKALPTAGGETLELYAEFGLDHNDEQCHAKLVIQAGV